MAISSTLTTGFERPWRKANSHNGGSSITPHLINDSGAALSIALFSLLANLAEGRKQEAEQKRLRSLCLARYKYTNVAQTKQRQIGDSYVDNIMAEKQNLVN